MKRVYKPCFAVLRTDSFRSLGGYVIKTNVTIKEILFDEEDAIAEVIRLNELNGSEDTVYWMQYTRLIEGRITKP